MAILGDYARFIRWIRPKIYGDFVVKYKNDYKFFHNRLKKLKITNKEFADFLDISNTSLTKWKNKNRVPTYALIALKYIEIIKYNADFLKETNILCKK